MRKKKILFCSEASWLSTGYSVYTKEVLNRLSQIDEFEVAELACYADRNDPNIQKTPWKVFPNKPLKTDPQYQSYSSNPTAQFGDQTFNEVLLDYQPDIVMDIRDPWMWEFEQRSPFREFFHWALMPTVDAEPQADQWINMFKSADSVFAYTEFGRDTILSQCDQIKFVDVASPAASEAFFPVEDKGAHKESMGLNKDSFIVGTVMRNQRRKLYPDLMEAFKTFLEQEQKDNIYLYLHTYYPDVGWEIPDLIQRYGLSSRVLMTYKCKKCNKISVDFFQNSVTVCNSCKSLSNQLVGIHNHIDETDLAKVYNVFDIYVQYANSEGFGMPQVEAAYCGLPVLSIDYSAMKSVVKNIGGIPMKPLSYYVECETGCKRAVPDNDLLVTQLHYLHSDTSKKLREIGFQIMNKALEFYNWDKTASVWAKRFKEIELVDTKKTWLSPSRIKTPTKQLPNNLKTNIDKVNFIFNSILCKPEWIGNYIWKRTLKDITFGYRCENMDKDFYFNESHKKSYTSNKPFSFEQACEEMYKLRMQMNEWEKARLQKFGIK